MELFDPFLVKQLFDAGQWGVETAGELGSLIRLARELRKAVVTIPVLDGATCVSTDVFPPFRSEPLPFFKGKRVGLVCSGGSGALVSLCGVKRALEEAGVEVAAVSVCSGGALWGSMIAAGLNAQQMVDFCFSWEPRDYIDFDIKDNLRRIARGMTGFIGLLKGEALERTFERRLGEVTLGALPIPLYSVAYNMDRGRVEYFGSKTTPGLRIGRIVRIAVALPLFVEPVRVGGDYYIDGGLINVLPVEPLVKYETGLDFHIAVNTILPEDFVGEDMHGWFERPFSILPGSRQLRFASWVEVARLNHAMAAGRIIVLHPVPCREIRGIKFYRYFVDKTLWPAVVTHSYGYTKRMLAALDRSARPGA